MCIRDRYRICGPAQERWPWAEDGAVHSIEVSRKAGVMDPVQQSAMKGAADIGLAGCIERIRTARKFLVRGDLTPAQLERLALKALANNSIEDVHIDAEDVPYPTGQPAYEFKLVTVPLREADDDELMRISREGVLSLTLEEMKTIQSRFAELDRDPTDLELEILAQTWSEHCVHKLSLIHI